MARDARDRGRGPFTVADVLATPEEVGGPRLRHQDVVLEVAVALRARVRAGGEKIHLAPTDVVLGDRVETYVLDGETYPAPTVHERGATVSATALPGFEVAVDDLLGSRLPA